MEQIYGIDQKRFSIIPHGISLPAQRTSIRVSNNPLKVLYVGRLEYRKGIDILLQAVPIILSHNADIEFQVIGNDDGDAYQKAFRISNTPIINSKVTFSGKVDDAALQNAYRQCDMFVAPSRYESFGLIYAEAMSYGKPVIGCKVGGVPEIITDGKNGLFAAAGDPEDLAEKVLLMANDHKWRKSMGENALFTVESRFTKEALAINSLSYYNSVVTV